MSEEVALRADNVSKDFVLPHEKVTSVKGLFTGITTRRRKTKGTQHALKDVSFEIKQGEFFGIVGRNGSGKSTMLKILAGIYQPTEGKIYTRGKLVPFIELGVGFNPELTGRENVYLNGAMLGFSDKQVESMYDSIVKFAELERFMDQKLKNYSSGMQVRLAFSMAIRAEADILLIDEVLAVGDADFQRKCYEYFKKLKKDKKTVVFVSHDMDAVREYCDRAVLINDSVLAEEGDADKISQAYTKLFNIDETAEPEDNGDRWGDGSVKIENVSVKVTDERITINETLRAKKDVEDYVLGFRITNLRGEQLTGTNTKLQKIRTGSLKKGQEVFVTWSFPNILSDGAYYVDPTVHSGNTRAVYDWWDRAKKFKVTKATKLPYYSIHPDFDVSVETADD